MRKEEQTMSAEENKLAERRLYEEVWNKRNLAAIDELIAPNVVEHNPNTPSQGPGLEGYRQSIESILTTFPDMKVTLEDLIAEGDKVVARWRASGTHLGEGATIPPTNKQVTITGIDILRYEGGKRVETWRQFDILGLLQQIGVVPPMGQTG
jgi:predicted ester cyclase